jgi:hypothetical protein
MTPILSRDGTRWDEGEKAGRDPEEKFMTDDVKVSQEKEQQDTLFSVLHSFLFTYLAHTKRSFSSPHTSPIPNTINSNYDTYPRHSQSRK